MDVSEKYHSFKQELDSLLRGWAARGLDPSEHILFALRDIEKQVIEGAFDWESPASGA